MSEPTVRVIRTSTTYELSEPVILPKHYSKGNVEIHRIVRDQSVGYDDSYSFVGYPLTSKGNRNGSLDYRHISDDDEAILIEIVKKSL